MRGRNGILEGFLKMSCCRQLCFKFFLPFLPLATLSSERAQATNIEIDLGPARVLTGISPQTERVHFHGLNGTPIFGETVSVDFFFANNGFVRIFTATDPLFDVSVNLKTNGAGLLGFLHGSGYLIDAHGNAIPGFGVTGSGSGYNGSLGISLFPLLKDSSGTPNEDLSRPLDFYGVHYDITFPLVDPSVEVTGGQFLLAASGMFTPFAIGPGRIPRDIVPDTGSTFMLLLFGLCGVIGARREL